jgi:hypothetical protein
MKRGLTWILLALVITVGIAAAALFFWLRHPQGTIERIADLPVLVQEIQQLSELVSVKYTVQKVVGLEEAKTPFGSERLLLIVQAQVLAGIELSELTTENVHLASDQCVTIDLPPPKILHVLLDERQTRVWDRQITWWTPWVPFNPDLERQARLAALESVKETAVEMGILDDARHNTEQGIRSLLKALGARSVEFEPES